MSGDWVVNEGSTVTVSVKKGFKLWSICRRFADIKCCIKRKTYAYHMHRFALLVEPGGIEPPSASPPLRALHA